MRNPGLVTVEHTLSADVAGSGTFTVNYAAGYNAGSFRNGREHQIASAQDRTLKSPADFTVSFGTANVTVTLAAALSLVAGSKLWVGFDAAGTEDGVDDENFGKSAKMTTVLVNLGAPDTADADGYCVSQSVGLGANFLINGALAVNGVGTPDEPRNVVAGWTTTATLTITGKDVHGNPVVEVTADGTSHTGKKIFKTVDSISSDTAITSATVGTGDILGLPFFVRADDIIAEFESGVLLGRQAETVKVPFQIDETDLLAATPISFLSPVAGTIRKVATVAWKAVTTGGAVTMKVNNTAVDGLSVTVGDGGGAGDVDSDTPTAGHASTVVAVDDELEILPASAFATAGALNGYVEIESTRAQQMAGTFVAGLATVSTSTSADVRGTYSPRTAPNGTLETELLVRTSDSQYQGTPQYAG